VPGLGTSLGRGGATTAQQDLVNADAILIMGSSMAENHPVGFQWVIEARERGATVIHVDPRFTRTSAMADLWVPLRAGSDVVFLGGLVRYALEHDEVFGEYVVRYTNAPVLLKDELRDTEELDGLFSGWDPATARYDPESWLYRGARPKESASGELPGHEDVEAGHAKERGGEAQQPPTAATAAAEGPERDETLQHPRCVYQVTRRHFARYTPEMVERACGVPAEQFLRVAAAFCSASGPERTGVICYAVGWTQHSVGVQIIRTAAILQLLLGNVGRPGGGILALRGHASIQGSTDIPTLYDILPGYLPMPLFEPDSDTLASYVGKHRTETGWWHNFDKYVVSLLKAWYGDAAAAANDFGFGWLPRVDGDHSHQGYWLEMADGKLEGLFVIGQNPAVGAPNARLERRALARLRWLVVRDLVEVETASFWYDSPEVERGELRPEEIPTEVFLLPAAGHAEKDGTFTNTQRLLQWHEKAVEPPGDCTTETWFAYHLGRRLRERVRASRRRRDRPLQALTWDYPFEGRREEPVVEAIAREIHGRKIQPSLRACDRPAGDSDRRKPTLGPSLPGEGRDGARAAGAPSDDALVTGFSELAADGSTACGCWIYSGLFAGGVNRPRQRQPRGPLGHGWGFAWPSDRRILYNRCSARPDGAPWSERKKLVWWDESAGEWTGHDVPDFAPSKPPSYRPPPGAKGDDAIAGDQPFTMHPDGLGWIWVASGLKDGPLPTHYEPLESPVENPLYGQRTNPVALPRERPDNRYAAPGDERYPYVLTTYRLTEHHTAGGMSRTLPHLAELQPELFVEISPELAREAGVGNGEWVTVATPRAMIEARALVTPRLKSLLIDGRVVHQVGVPYHWGPRGVARGDVANDLVAISQEPNVRIMEAKALVCSLVAGRRPRGADVLRQLEAASKSAGRDERDVIAPELVAGADSPQS
jgi:formate dehydrogenase major subunit